MERKQIVDLLRSLSVFLVWGAHLQYCRGFDPARGFDTSSFFRNGHYGVSLFFVVSGYLITGVITGGRSKGYRVRFKDFYIRRVARILPLFLLVVFLAILLFLFLHRQSPLSTDILRVSGVSYNFWFWAALFLFLFNWIVVLGGGTGGGIQWAIMWSLAVEEQFYLSYPWILKWIRNENRLLIFLTGVILSGVAYRAILAGFHHGEYYQAVVSSFGSFDQIAMGALLFFLSKRWKGLLNKKLRCVFLCGFGFLLMGLAYFGMDTGTTYLHYGIIFGPFVISLGAFFFLLGGLQLDFFESKAWGWLAFPGKLSYGCYLWHPLMLLFLAPWLLRMNFTEALLVFALTTTWVSSISYFFFEQPANRWVRKTFGGPGLKASKPLRVKHG
jgi:peptidoglycan/LPS O-acetylase OafA/YrhL